MPRVKRPDLSRDQRIQIITLRGTGMTYQEIRAHLLQSTSLDFSERQIQTACDAGHPTPSKRAGRPSILTEAQIGTQFLRRSSMS